MHLPWRRHSAARRLASVDGASLVDLDRSTGWRGTGGRGADAALDLRRHGHESLLHVRRILGRRFKEWNAQLFGVLL